MGEITVRIDLQDIYRANPKAFIAASAVIAAAFAFLVVKGVSSGGGSSAKSQPAARVTATTKTTTSTVASNGVTTPNPSYHPAYATSVPSSAVDQRFAAVLGQDGSTMAALEAVTPPSPAWTTDYPQIGASMTKSDKSYAVAFLEELLDRNYRMQSRADLGRWVQAEAADELLPGVPAEAGDHTLYAELMDPTAVGDSPGPVPSATEWATLSRAGTTQHVYDVFVNPDPQWAELQSNGFTSADPLMGVDDVTGVIAMTAGGRTTIKHFSTVVELGSALHHPGYGSWGINQWEVN